LKDLENWEKKTFNDNGMMPVIFVQVSLLAPLICRLCNRYHAHNNLKNL